MHLSSAPDETSRYDAFHFRSRRDENNLGTRLFSDKYLAASAILAIGCCLPSQALLPPTLILRCILHKRQRNSKSLASKPQHVALYITYGAQAPHN
jgi:hypothetical protein